MFLVTYLLYTFKEKVLKRKMYSMDQKSSESSIVVCMITRYRQCNPDEEFRKKLAICTIKEAKKLGYAVIVIDDGSDKLFVDTILAEGVEVFPNKGSTYGSGRKEAISAGFDTDKHVVAIIEPEKFSFVKNIAASAKPILDGKADIVIPKRLSLKSYPVMQQHSESFVNIIWKKLTGLDLDIMFGPQMISHDACKFYTSYDGKYGDKWDALIIPIIKAIKDGMRCISSDVDFEYPTEQKDFEDAHFMFAMKRLEQAYNIGTAIEKCWKE